jgi:hypothetical protein
VIAMIDDCQGKGVDIVCVFFACVYEYVHVMSLVRLGVFA